jgi:hypothetical protein
MRGLLLAQPLYRIFYTADPGLKTFSVYGGIGTASYFGDLCPTGDCFSRIGANLNLGVQRRVNDYLGYYVSAQWYRIGGNDATTNATGRIKRNLSFVSNNLEFLLGGKFEFLNYNTFRYISRDEFPLGVYATTGIGITTLNPKASYEGKWYSLRKLQTEGVAYSPIAMVIPFGIGVDYAVHKQLRVSLDAVYRWTTTDYLDDVSTVYPDPERLKSDLARKLSNRTDEITINGQPILNPQPGWKRGDPNKKDGYLIFSLKAEYIFRRDPLGEFIQRITPKRSSEIRIRDDNRNSSKNRKGRMQ